MVAIHGDVLREKLQKEVPKPVYWDDSGTAQELKRGDHLYIVQYPKLGDAGEHRRCFGGDIIQGTYGSCSALHANMLLYDTAAAV